MARWSNQLGNGATAIFDGNCGIRSDGHDPDIADQLSSIRCNSESVGLAAGAATVGCCCNMIGFAVASFRENGVGGLIAQGVGTSMLQVPNIVKNH